MLRHQNAKIPQSEVFGVLLGAFKQSDSGEAYQSPSCSFTPMLTLQAQNKPQTHQSHPPCFSGTPGGGGAAQLLLFRCEAAHGSRWW